MKLYEDLKWRGLLYSMTDPEIGEKLNQEKLTFYMGADPTANSLHVGHLLAYLVAKRLADYGHRPILVIGGGTGLIGDPSFKSQERQLLTIEESLMNANGIRQQVLHLLPDARIVNNYDWISSLNAIEFLRDIGKSFNVASMITKESVKSRIDNGLSFTEFAYQVLQAWDFEYLYSHHDCNLQIGGQDQWGNITAGLDLIRKQHGVDAKAYGFTFPLVTKSDGTKFGKTESGTLWLDKNKTSVYDFYQFWINTADEDVVNRLKQFTFLGKDEIDHIEDAFKKAPHLREAQKILAREVTVLVHGESEYLEAKKISEALFSGEIHLLNKDEIEIGFRNVIQEIPGDEWPLVELLMESKLVSSKRQARELISSKALTVNGNRVEDIGFSVRRDQAIDNVFTVIRKGKKTYTIIKHL